MIEERQKTRENWVISIKDKLEKVHRDEDMATWGKLCIYRVPDYRHKNKMYLYVPRTVSLDPYHHGEEQTRAMEYHKWRTVNKVLERTKQGIEMYIDAMTELEEKARACYQGHIPLSSNEFTEMLFLDGFFVLELFKGTVYGFSEIGYARNDPVFVMQGLMHSIQLDMVMLENQLPLFVLNRLLELQLGTQNQIGMVAYAAIRFFDRLMPTAEAWTEPSQSLSRDNAFNRFGDIGELHCLDVFRRSLFNSSLTVNRRSKEKRWSRNMFMQHQELLYCVTELREAGLEFREKITDQFWNIEFRNGCLEIPRLVIHEGTNILLSNFIAFEQCHLDSSNDVTSYICFMNNIIDSYTDVRYLRRRGILELNVVSDLEVVDMFKGLGENLFFQPQSSYLFQLSVEVNRYRSRKWNVLMATLRHQYFKNRWAYFCSLGVTMLVLTLFQILFSIYAYYKPNSQL